MKHMLLVTKLRVLLHSTNNTPTLSFQNNYINHPQKQRPIYEISTWLMCTAGCCCCGSVLGSTPAQNIFAHSSMPHLCTAFPHNQRISGRNSNLRPKAQLYPIPSIRVVYYTTALPVSGKRSSGT